SLYHGLFRWKEEKKISLKDSKVLEVRCHHLFHKLDRLLVQLHINIQYFCDYNGSKGEAMLIQNPNQVGPRGLNKCNDQGASREVFFYLLLQRYANQASC